MYPVELRDEEIWIDIRETPLPERLDDVMRSLRAAFDDHDYTRLARESARWMQLGGDRLEILRFAIAWSWQHLEFGWTHAFAGMADWLQLFDRCDGDDESQLVCLLESIGHCAYDVLRAPQYPYSIEIRAFDEAAFLRAIEAEHEHDAIALMRAARAAAVCCYRSCADTCRGGEL